MRVLELIGKLRLKWLAVAASFAFYFPVFGGILFPMFWPFGITLLFYLSWWPWLKHFPDWWYFLTSNIYIEGLYGLTMVAAQNCIFSALVHLIFAI